MSGIGAGIRGTIIQAQNGTNPTDGHSATFRMRERPPSKSFSRLAGLIFSVVLIVTTLVVMDRRRFFSAFFLPRKQQHYSKFSTTSSELDYIHMGWKAQISQELTKFKSISKKDFVRFEKVLGENAFYGVRIVIHNWRVYFKLFIPQPNGSAGHTLGYALATLLAVKRLVQHAHQNDWPLPGRLLLHMQFGDGCTRNTEPLLPIYGYNNALGHGALENCAFTVGFPSYDWWWPGQNMLVGARSRMDLARPTHWSRKRPVLLFRGKLNSWDGARIAAMWASRQHPDLIDAKLVGENDDACSRFLGVTEVWAQKRPSEVEFAENCSDILGDWKSPSDFAKYKYWLDVDGHGATFRFKNYLFGGAVIFKVESEYYQHFHNVFRPWVHYIPIHRENFVLNIAKRVRWAREHDAECREMVRRTRSLANKVLTHEQTMWYQLEVLSQVSSRLDFQPSRENMIEVCCSDFDSHLSRKWGGKSKGFTCTDAIPCSQKHNNTWMDDIQDS